MLFILLMLASKEKRGQLSLDPKVETEVQRLNFCYASCNIVHGEVGVALPGMSFLLFLQNIDPAINGALL